MKIIRVFVSSPGDVQVERVTADRLIRTIAEELGIPVSIQYSNLLRVEEPFQPPHGSGEVESGELILCPYFWEYQRFSPELGYQDQIPNTAQFDLVICILWSRLGTKLHSRFRMPDGSEPRSGTEFEIAWAKAQREKTPGIPALHVYRNRSQPSPPLDPLEKREAFFRQWDSLKAFFASWEKDSEGQFIGAFNNYRNLEEFERLFREHFRDFLFTQISNTRRQLELAERVRRWKENPFRGLQIFEFEHAPIFAGRTLATDGVLGALARQAEAGRPFVLVLGASGSGKSSLVRAGVLPLLVEPGVIEGIGLWRRSVMRPAAGGSQTDMFDALAAGLLALEAVPELADLESAEPVKDLAAELRANPQGVADRVKDKLNQVASEYRLRQEQRLREMESDFRQRQRPADAENARLQREKLEPPRTRLALVVDQLEELFTSGFSEELQSKFASALSALARSGRVFVLVTLRNDFYARYQQFADLVELAKPAGKFDVRPPTEAEISAMMKYPAEAAGLTFEVDPQSGQPLYDALRDAAVQQPESLPLLEHALEQLFTKQQERGDDCLRWADYRAFGGLEGALAQHAETTFQQLRPHEQGAFPAVMRQLITLGQGDGEVINRRTVPYRDLCADANRPNERAGAQAFVDLFIRNRLLVADTDPRGTVVVSVAHEALLRNWPRLQDWLKTNREFLRMRDRLDANLQLWKSRGEQKEDLLPSGLPLTEGETLLKESAASLGASQVDYIHASIAERQRERNRRSLIRNGALALFALLALGAGIQWWRAEAERRTAEHAVAIQQRQLEEASWASFNQAERLLAQPRPDWRQAIALFGRAVQFNPGNQVASERFFNELILNRDQIPNLVLNLQHAGSVYSAVFSPDGSRVLTASYDKTAKLWEAASGNLLATFNHDGWVRSATFSPDGSRVLTASGDKTAKLWEAATGKLLASFNHDGEVRSATFSPDGSRVLTASTDETAKLWDTASGKMLATFRHDGAVSSAVFSPDGYRCLTAGEDKTAKLWEVASGKTLVTFKHDGAVSSAVFSPDGCRCLTASNLTASNDTAKLWDSASGKLLASFNHDGQISSAVFSPDGSRVLTASTDKTAKLWETATGKLLATFNHDGWVNSATFSPDGSRILTASQDKTAKLWEAATGKLMATFNHDGEVNSAEFTPDGSRILTASRDGTGKLREAATGKLLASFNHDGEVNSAAFSPDGSRVITASYDKTAKLWEAATGKLLATLNHDGQVTSATFSPDGLRILTTSFFREAAKLWEAATGKLLATLNHDGLVTSAVFSPDGSRVLTVSYDKTAKLWEAATGKLLATFNHDDAVWHAAFSPDGSRVITASWDKTAKLWEAASGKLLATFNHDGIVNFAAFSPDGTRILTASWDNTAKLWEAATGKLLATFNHDGWVRSATFSPDGSRILTASQDKTAKLWDAATGKLLATFNHGDAVWHAAFSPDGSCILTAFFDGEAAKLWEAATGELLATLNHDGVVESATFSPDGSRVLTASGDKTAKLWEAATGKPLATFIHDGEVNSAAFSPDGSRVLTASRDNTAKVWEAATGRLLAKIIAQSSTGAVTSDMPLVRRQIDLLSELASRYELAGDGSLIGISAERCQELRQKLLAAGDDQIGRFCRWYLGSPRMSAVFLGGTATATDWIHNVIGTSPTLNQTWVSDANVVLPEDSLVELALAQIEKNASQADFLRRASVKHLPADPIICVEAAQLLLKQKDPTGALVATEKALRPDPMNPAGLRGKASALGSLGRGQEALSAYQTLLQTTSATAGDYRSALDVAGELQQADLCRQIFTEGVKKFSDQDDQRDLYSGYGWALLDLNRSSDALAAFRRTEQLLGPGTKLGTGLLAGEVASAWASGAKDQAVQIDQRLIATDSQWADPAFIQKQSWPETEKRPLLEALNETLRRHPELQPKPGNN